MTDETQSSPSDFVRDIVARDVASGKNEGRVHTRFPPEPNGYLHIGHAKSICLNHGIAQENEGGLFNLRFDDTNPAREEVEYVESIQEDVRWLGAQWDDRMFFASDYFEQLHDHAVALIRSGDAYVCSLSADEMREHRGTLTEPGKDSPHRDRSVEENITLFEGMRAGEFDEGSHVLRAKIDMASPNMNMRDPTIYRIRRVHHHRTGDDWCIYPMYDYAHCVSDSIEGITHSICTLEFEHHRPLYDWFLDKLGIHHPQQIEFNRLNLTYTLMSKRKLLELVEGGHVSGWDDPRMPTISGLRRRGYTATSIREFCKTVGVSKVNSVNELALLEHAVREDLNTHSPRVMAVLRPLKLVITNYPDDLVEEMEAKNHPQNPDMGTRMVPFTKEIMIEQTDFMEDPPKKFFRLGPGREVRLRYGYLVTCTDFVKDEDTGEVTEVHCTYDPETKGGNAPDGRKVKGTIHWVSASQGSKALVRLYETLFTTEDPLSDGDFLPHLNPNSIEVISDAIVEPTIAKCEQGDRFQFERIGYFTADTSDHSSEHCVLNRTVGLRDSWAKKGK